MIDPLCWTRLSAAMEFYQGFGGFKYIDVPWIVPEHIVNMTLDPAYPRISAKTRGLSPDQSCTVSAPLGILVGSAEQGILDMVGQRMPSDRVMACSPCFRHESAYDELTRPYFMKVELGVFHESMSVMEVVVLARRFMLRMGMPIVEIKGTQIGYDLVAKNGVELGSYGMRELPFSKYIYGTGIAEPRFGVALAQNRIN